MSQEVNPYLVTSVGLTTSMPYNNALNQNLMKAKKKKRIMDKERADLKKSTSWNMSPLRNVAGSEIRLKGKHHEYDGR